MIQILTDKICSSELFDTFICFIFVEGLLRMHPHPFSDTDGVQYTNGFKDLLPQQNNSACKENYITVTQMGFNTQMDSKIFCRNRTLALARKTI